MANVYFLALAIGNGEGIQGPEADGWSQPDAQLGSGHAADVQRDQSILREKRPTRGQRATQLPAGRFLDFNAQPVSLLSCAPGLQRRHRRWVMIERGQPAC